MSFYDRNTDRQPCWLLLNKPIVKLASNILPGLLDLWLHLVWDSWEFWFFFFITASHFPILLNTEDISDVCIASFTCSVTRFRGAWQNLCFNSGASSVITRTRMEKSVLCEALNLFSSCCGPKQNAHRCHTTPHTNNKFTTAGILHHKSCVLKMRSLLLGESWCLTPGHGQSGSDGVSGECNATRCKRQPGSELRCPPPRQPHLRSTGVFLRCLWNCKPAQNKPCQKW